MSKMKIKLHNSLAKKENIKISCNFFFLNNCMIVENTKQKTIRLRYHNDLFAFLEFYYKTKTFEESLAFGECFTIKLPLENKKT